MVAKEITSEQGRASRNSCIRFDHAIGCCKIGGLGSALSGSSYRRSVEQEGERTLYQFFQKGDLRPNLQPSFYGILLLI